MITVFCKNGPRRVITTVVLMVMLVIQILVANVAVHAASGSHTWYAQVGSSSSDQAIQGAVFLPGVLWINKGDIVWLWFAAQVV